MRWRLEANIVVIAMLMSLQACHVHQKFGATTPDRVVDRYMSALEAKDRLSIAQLLPKGEIATTEIAAKIALLGGHQLQERHVTYTKIKPTLWLAQIDGTYIDPRGRHQKFRDTIATIYQGQESWKLYSGRWYLLLSKSDPNRSTAPAASSN